MKKSSSVKSDFVMPIVVLGVICLVITALLALTNSATEPVIKKAAQERAEAARAEIIPDADGFELLEVEGLPENVDEVYGTTNDVGYIFMLSPMGYGGEMNLPAALDVMSHEYTHCVTTSTMNSNLYEDDYGAINEAMSDIMGNL